MSKEVLNKVLEVVIVKGLSCMATHQRASNLFVRGIFASAALHDSEAREFIADQARFNAAQLGWVPVEMRVVSRVLSRFGNRVIEQAIAKGMEDFKQGRHPIEMLDAWQRTHTIIEPGDLPGNQGGNYEQNRWN